MAYGTSNDHATDDVTRPGNVMVMTPICLRLITSTTVGHPHADSFTMQLLSKIESSVSTGHVPDDNK